MYGMVRTTVYLTEELKAELELAAEKSGESEAEIIRRGVAAAVAEIAANAARRPRIPLFTSSDPGLAERVDEALKGFFIRWAAIETGGLRVASPAELVVPISPNAEPDTNVRTGSEDEVGERWRGHRSIGSPSLRAASATSPRSPS